jgi:3-hydroxyisobutyrate dehydrogenase-like beta-hydroxyacid dehydrogenase
MGAAMAGHLLRQGVQLAVWNRTPGSAGRERALEREGASRAATPAECVADARFVITMVRDAAALRAVLCGHDGVVSGLRRRAIVIDMSTVGRSAAREAARAVEAAGGHFVDAPVSGTVEPASRGQLLAMIGGHPRVVKRAEPLLERLCSRVIHAGEVGQGQALKVILNGVGSHHLVAFTSMLALGQRAGLSRKALVEAFTTGAFASPSYVGKKAKVLARDWSPEFTLDLTAKDVALNVELQEELGIHLPVHRAIATQVRQAVESGLGELDLFAMERFYER